jgi:methionyl aminopeptidase
MRMHHSNVWRTTSEEKRYQERMVNQDPEQTYQSIRKAAEVHRLVRKHAWKHIRPGMTLMEIAENIEDGTRALVEENGLDAGIAFPTGLNLNNCAAHYSLNGGDTTGMSRGFHHCTTFVLMRCAISIIQRRCIESRFRCSRQGTNN